MIFLNTCMVYVFSFFCGLNVTTFHSIAFCFLFSDAHFKKSVISNHNFKFGHSDIKRSFPNQKIQYPEVILHY